MILALIALNGCLALVSGSLMGPLPKSLDLLANNEARVTSSHFKTAAVTVDGYYTQMMYNTSSSCNDHDFVYGVGFKANVCMPTSSGSYKVSLVNATTCSGSYITYFTDDYCQTVDYYQYLSDYCSGTVKTSCHATVYAPVASLFAEVTYNSSFTPSCSDAPDEYTAYSTEQCIYFGYYFKYQCVGSDRVFTTYNDSLCLVPLSTSSSPANECYSGTTYSYYSATEDTCQVTTGSVSDDADDGDSNSGNEADNSSGGSKLGGLNRLSWVFIFVGALFVLFVVGMIYRWWVRRSRPAKESTGEVKMVTLFTAPQPSTSAVRYSAAAATDIRI